MKKYKHISILILSFGIFISCTKTSTDPTILRIKHSEQDFMELSSNIQLPDKKLNLEDLIAFALNRNLDLLSLHHEYEIQHEVATGEKFSMLPSINFNSEFSQRSHEAGSRAKSLVTGLESSGSSTSSERRSEKRDLSAVWSLLDFGLSYYRARQESNRALIIKQRHQRLRQNLILDVIQSYWKAIITQKAVEGAESIVLLAKERQENLQKQIERQTISEIEGLENEERLIEMQIRLQTFQSDLYSAKAELASLLGLPPGTEFELSDIKLPTIENIDMNIEELEKSALNSRPELFIQDLEGEVNADEIRATMLSYFPNASLFGSYNYDRNHYLIQKSWLNMGLRAAWNLLSFPRYQHSKTIAEKRLAHIEKSRKSLSIGILTQVRLAYLVHMNAIKQHEMAKDLHSVKSRLFEAVKKGEKLGEYGGSEILRLQAEALFSKINSLTAYAEMHISLERINNAMGKPLYFSYLSIDEIESSSIGLKEDDIEKDSIEDKEEETIEESKAIETPELIKEESSGKRIISEEAKEEEEETVDIKEADESLSKQKLEGYTADEELEDLEEEEFTNTADEELSQKELEEIKRARKKKEQKQEEPRKRNKRKIRLVIESKKAPSDKRILEISSSVFKNIGENTHENKKDIPRILRVVNESLIVIPELFKKPKYINPLPRKLSDGEILSLASEDYADENISDDLLKRIMERGRTRKTLTKEEIFASIEEDFADELMNDTIAQRIIEGAIYRKKLSEIKEKISIEQKKHANENRSPASSIKEEREVKRHISMEDIAFPSQIKAKQTASTLPSSKERKTIEHIEQENAPLEELAKKSEEFSTNLSLEESLEKNREKEVPLKEKKKDRQNQSKFEKNIFFPRLNSFLSRIFCKFSKNPTPHLPFIQQKRCLNDKTSFSENKSANLTDPLKMQEKHLLKEDMADETFHVKQLFSESKINEESFEKLVSQNVVYRLSEEFLALLPEKEKNNKRSFPKKHTNARDLYSAAIPERLFESHISVILPYAAIHQNTSKASSQEEKISNEYTLNDQKHYTKRDVTSLLEAYASIKPLSPKDKNALIKVFLKISEETNKPLHSYTSIKPLSPKDRNILNEALLKLSEKTKTVKNVEAKDVSEISIDRAPRKTSISELLFEYHTAAHSLLLAPPPKPVSSLEANENLHKKKSLSLKAAKAESLFEHRIVALSTPLNILAPPSPSLKKYDISNVKPSFLKAAKAESLFESHIAASSFSQIQRNPLFPPISSSKKEIFQTSAIAESLFESYIRNDFVKLPLITSPLEKTIKPSKRNLIEKPQPPSHAMEKKQFKKRSFFLSSFNEKRYESKIPKIIMKQTENLSKKMENLMDKLEEDYADETISDKQLVFIIKKKIERTQKTKNAEFSKEKL